MTLEHRHGMTLTSAQRTLLAYIDGCATVAEVNAQPPGWAFRSTYHLLAAHGTFFAAAPRPIEMPKLTDRLCYSNAATTAATYAAEGLLYAEGFATATVRGQQLPLAHGWCVTADGTVADPTWDFDPNAIYFGIAFQEPAVWPHDGGGLLTEPDRLLPLLRDGLSAAVPTGRQH
ncbi:hypothetical protein [Actinoplanes sp. NBRC 103695]|uniref:hypothetical protein n=1 Tax=Actinoplanes sp. NBRC 103695 TaxID=3032202 RepID=UPI0024A1A3E1|nr:hypothetical protein [Actinoplanes sp. NBRC 103695]GLY99827.1 hypothetical protein Acsp02_70800 [Actinoplanes sp. NBRC 103695]